ncbi:MAG: LytTR family transcriptional regulator DNA-binding domain-containing protein [Lachnospiraceae bacterium]|nr:LytTR family transcriptional regulator DNA-binding domain-containing protein [Lachnospiraceae bacterium]
MKIDIKQITEGEDSVTIRYRELTSPLNRIIGILRGDSGKLWGRTDEESICVNYDDVLYLESVDDKVFAYTTDKVLRLEGSLNSFMLEADNEIFFRCSKSMVINVNRVASLKSLSSNRIDASMEGGEHIIISRRYASEFRKLLKGEK